MSASSSAERTCEDDVTVDAVSRLTRPIVRAFGERPVSALFFASGPRLVGPSLLDVDAVGEDVLAAQRAVQALGHPARHKLRHRDYGAGRPGDAHPRPGAGD